MPKAWRSEFIFTPPMEAMWAKVLGKARTREEGDNPTWSIDLVGAPEDKEVAALQQQIRGFMIEAHGSKPNVSRHGVPLKRQEAKDENGEMSPTGLLVIKAKRIEQRRGSDVVLEPPLVVDSQNKKWPATELIGNGSIVRAKIHFWAWNRGSEGVGLSTELHAVQVIKHLPYESAGSTEAGFDVVPGGASAPDTAEDPFAEQLRNKAQEVDEELPF